ncbi:hypothetical protein WKR88_00445 [Trinickia caryophylli]|uniref:Predicted lipoprotein with conserved Yx(FWY)xxD motif n=1 Tax=Trinickia caryophylli TaxID=28094 RepID=A0A1X7D273_TRICW|nr:hypothetical protein [Trinickia caryophylli]PMS13581.1 hypothetical protein C0Z17_04695 [Trinickia caryophylli]TRX15250.1 hypothetical protein FNF07_29165 [Trinickia caryophylli]WQE15124.1 hypothetical protein U0034_21485 [Trinickia caryophylli]SMF06942.1 Predicted lipoprotein with conserved Yx(FWY)xxD motif [Trinickia caryophylli]GLU31138.1 lipoprotein [Trinickia caryophylli]
MIKKALWALACLAPMAVLAEQPVPRGGTLVDEHGMTLYTFDADAKAGGTSACTGQCASIWPAATADDYDKASGDWSLAQTADGKRQWAYKGQRLYRFAKDEKAGDTKGDGVKGMWHIAKP